ncbi:response regulator transcription factor [Solwaraspora sp. WMMB335]|uniref:response regulator transcription factor n=1 Tax=Solwaraspora sp. WMMB335 TaxID=3404118 RepID=UPI003B93A0DC
MIRILLVEELGLVRDALRTVLSSEDDMAVVVDVAAVGHVVPEVQRVRPDVVLVNTDRVGPEIIRMARAVTTSFPATGVLVISASRSPEALSAALRAGVRGFVGTDIAPADLVKLVRAMAAGESVVDDAVAVAALRPSENPLTERERQVLQAVADGWPLREIGTGLHLSYGTVRNYLSRIMRKTGSRNRIEAIRRAQQEGWI